MIDWCLEVWGQTPDIMKQDANARFVILGVEVVVDETIAPEGASRKK
jgi:hypothetical protein